MKKIISLLCSAAIVALSLAGCSKNETPEQGDQAVGVERIVSFNANTPSTKSYFGDKTSSGYPTVWTTNTKVGISVNYLTPKAAEVTPVGTGNKATFDASVTQPTSATEFVFYAVSPSSVLVSGNSTYSSFLLDIPSSQSPTKGSVDEAAHIMFAKSATLTTWPEEGTTVNLDFSHLAAYGKFTLENFREDGTSGKVKINSVNIESDSVIAGRFYYYPATDHFSPNPASKVVTVNTENIQYTTNNNDLTIWFAIRPVDLKGSNMKITLNTTDGTFEKTFQFPADKGTFLSGKVGSFVIDMTGVNPKQDEVYALVTDYDVLKEDSKVIIAAAEADYAIGTAQNQNNRAGAAVTKTTENNVSLIKNPASDVQIFVLEQGTKSNTIAFNCENGDQAGLYIGSPYSKTVSGNYLRSLSGGSDEFTAGNGSFDVDLVHEDLSNGSLDYALLTANSAGEQNYMRFNASSSNIFSLYKQSSSVTGKVALYVLVGSGQGDPLINKDPKVATPEISFNSERNEVTITCATAGALIGYTDDGTDPQADSNGPIGTTKVYSGPFTISQTTTIKAFAGGLSGYQDSEIAIKECVVSGSYDFETIAQLNALKTSTATNHSGKLTNAVVSFVPDNKNAVIKDATGSVLFYLNSGGVTLKQGQTFTGEVTVKLVDYNNCGEITEIDATFVGDETPVEPQTVTLADLAGNLSTWQNAYVKVTEGLEVTAINGKNITVKKGSNTYVVYSAAAAVSGLAVGDVITSVVGTIANFSGNDQIKAWKVADIEFTHTATEHAINIVQPTDAGTSYITVKVGGSEITSGTKVLEGTEVQAEITIDGYYDFTTWDITGAVNLSSKLSHVVTFEVGTEDITIKANLVKRGTIAPETFDASTQGYTNGQEVASYTGTNMTITFDKGSNSNTPKYYTTGTAVRVYAGGFFTVSSSTAKISKVEITFGSGDGTNEITADSGTYTTGVWTGSASSVKFTVGGTTGHRRIKSIKVTFEE